MEQETEQNAAGAVKNLTTWKVVIYWRCFQIRRYTQNSFEINGVQSGN